MSFLQTQTNNNNRNLTEQQQKFLDALSGEAQGDIKAALQVAGYKDTSYYAVVKSLRQEIIDTANTILAHSAPKAAKKLVDVLMKVHFHLTYISLLNMQINLSFMVLRWILEKMQMF